MELLKKVYRTLISIHSRIKERVNEWDKYIKLKEIMEYKKFVKSFNYTYSSDYIIDDESECIYRRTFLSERNKELVELCMNNDVLGIGEWYDADDGDQMYYDEYFENRMSMRIIARHIIEHVPKSAYLLDVACGHGSVDKELASKGFKIKGIDLNKNRIDELKPYIYQVECIDVDHICTEEKYDVIISLEMLEHVPDITKTLRKMYDILNSKGIIYISVPNKYMIDHEQHVRLFEKDSMVKLLSNSGFSVISTVVLPYLNREWENDLVCVCVKED